MIRVPPTSTLFPYTTLFRSSTLPSTDHSDENPRPEFRNGVGDPGRRRAGNRGHAGWRRAAQDRKSTRLNSSHVEISYAVFCLKKKTKHLSIQQHDHPLRYAL